MPLAACACLNALRNFGSRLRFTNRWLDRAASGTAFRVSVESSFSRSQESVAAPEQAAVRHLARGHGWLTAASSEGERSVAHNPDTPTSLIPAPAGSRELDRGVRIEPAAGTTLFVPDVTGSDIGGIGRCPECHPSSSVKPAAWREALAIGHPRTMRIPQDGYAINVFVPAARA